MLKKTMQNLMISSVLSAAVISGAQAGENCMQIGDTGMPNFVPQDDGSMTIVAPLSGSVKTASGKITSQRKTSTGLEMVMETIS